MKIALLFAAVALVSTNAFASKSRKAAISNSVTAAADVQDVWTNAAYIHKFGDLMTFEFGATAAAPASAAYNGTNITSFTAWENAAIPEGGIFKAQGDAKWGFYVGHRSTASDLIKWASGYSAAQMNHSNQSAYSPIAFFYGRKSGDYQWGASLSHYSSKYSSGTTERSNEGMGLRLGASKDKWEAYVNLGLSAKEKMSATEEYKGNASYQAGAKYALDEMTVYGEILSASGTKTTSGTDVKGSFDTMFVGLERKLKADASHVFYGAKYSTQKLKNDGSGAAAAISEITNLPLYLGFEADAASWLALRGQVSKPFFMDTTKLTAGTTEIKLEGATDASMNFGASFKFNKSTLDWTVAAAGSGTLSTTNFGTNASYTYNF